MHFHFTKQWDLLLSFYYSYIVVVVVIIIYPYIAVMATVMILVRAYPQANHRHQNAATPRGDRRRHDSFRASVDLYAR